MNIDLNLYHNLEDERVLLRPLELADFDHLKHFVINEPEIWKYSLVAIRNEVDLQNYIATAVAAREAGKEYPFIVFDKAANQYAGCTRFYDIQPTYNSLQLGYTWYGKQYQGTGLNRHCKYLLLEFAFEQIGVDRVEFRADATNAKSIAAMRAIGCTVEGILRSHLPKPDGTRRDSIILSLLRREWTAGIKQSLADKLK